MHNPFSVPVIGRTAAGETVWYTGRAGKGFVSALAGDAFLYETVEAARRRASILNRGTLLHGIWFVACVGDLAAEARAYPSAIPGEAAR